MLRVFCADAWPGLIDECESAMISVIARKVQRVQKAGCVAVQSYSMHWPCLLPQHGPGMKHLRRIELAGWQRPIVDAHSGDLLRGLIHSDGCRTTNRIKRGDKLYIYPRYNFSNESRDIMGLCQESLDRLGIAWRMCRPNMLSVARRDDVAAGRVRRPQVVTGFARPGIAGHLGGPFGLASLPGPPGPPGVGWWWDGVGWAGAGCEGVAGVDGGVLADGGSEVGRLADGEAEALGLGVPAERRSVSQ
jgi:hypothetical protein